MKRLRLTSYLFVPLLWLAFALMVASALQKSSTVDEQSHLFRGAAYLKANATHFLLGHPIGNSALAALPLLTEPDLQLPTEIPAWETGNWSVAGDYFLWRIGNNAQRIIFLGRLPMIFCTLILGCFIFRWGRQLGNIATGLIAATLILFDPNILAHGRLISSDVTLTLFWAVAVYGFWRWSQHGKRSAIVLAGFGLGMASLMKYNAAFLLPTLAILAGYEWWKRRTRAPLHALTGTVAVGGLVIWGVNRFALTPLPGGAFWDDLFWQMQYFGRNTGGYLLGNYNPDGSLLYFPIAFLIKTPIPTLLLIGTAILFTVNPSSRVARPPSVVYLLIPAMIFCLTAFTAGFNIGIRHLLPLYPYLYLALALAISRLRSTQWRIATTSMVAGTVLVAVWIFPNYLAYFNQLIGGPENGWRYLADSNVDWGQELPALAQWQRTHDEKTLYLSYFGTAHADAYGIEFEPIPAPIITPDPPPTERQAHDPRHPRPGYYAISINNLIGFPMQDGERDMYAAFREMEPIAKVGNAIFVYEVAATGAPVSVAFAGTRPALLPEAVYAQWGTNDVRVRWFENPDEMLVVPAGNAAYIVSSQPVGEILRESVDLRVELSAENSHIYAVTATPFNQQTTPKGETVTFLASLQNDALGHDPLTAWRVEERLDGMIKHFVHATDPQTGEILAQADDVMIDAFSTLEAGDLYLRLSKLSLDADTFAVTTGLYDAATGIRLADPILLYTTETMPTEE